MGTFVLAVEAEIGSEAQLSLVELFCARLTADSKIEFSTVCQVEERTYRGEKELEPETKDTAHSQ